MSRFFFKECAVLKCCVTSFELPDLLTGIARLIDLQENIKYFEWKDDFEVDYDFIDSYEEILISLEKKANILNHLKIYFQYIDGYEHISFQKVLSKFRKLKTLIIVDTDILYISEEQSKKLVYPDLEILYIDNITINAASIIIENSGGHLKEILLFKYNDYYDTNFNNDSFNFIRKVYEHCPLVEYLSLEFSSSKEHFTEFEKLLNVCKNLKSLCLFILSNDGIETTERFLEIGEELLKALIRSKSNNLIEIRFYANYFKFSLKALEEFLNKWKGRPAISIFTTDPIYKGEDYMNLINEYKNYGVIKDFKYEFGSNIYSSHLL
ncbi:hypothetical protein C1645_809567 [Glomus cerebriforme]|uniref:F-box domain-containing protein n=1 Tax=Glomus cerebriforme TaxID=658196 RepID=A0A397SF50_9GLOM|nr:hypothetical protein C1645_809567 [Glomus cerebriforme]